MNENDKQLAKTSALAVADGIASSIPGLSIAWELTKALTGNGLKLRQQKALEWVEMIRDNPKVYSQNLLANPFFQDGFVYSIEKYLIERSEEKRRHLRSIFLGFATAEDMESFPLEKFSHTLSQLSGVDMTVLAAVDVNRQDTNYQIYPANSDKLENIYNLINEGILLDLTGNRIGYPQDSPFVRASIYGKALIEHLQL